MIPSSLVLWNISFNGLSSPNALIGDPGYKPKTGFPTTTFGNDKAVKELCSRVLVGEEFYSASNTKEKTP